MEAYQELINKISGEKEIKEPKITKTERAKEFVRDFKSGVFKDANTMKDALVEYNDLNKYDIKYQMVKDVSKSVYQVVVV